MAEPSSFRKPDLTPAHESRGYQQIIEWGGILFVQPDRDDPARNEMGAESYRPERQMAWFSAEVPPCEPKRDAEIGVKDEAIHCAIEGGTHV